MPKEVPKAHPPMPKPSERTKSTSSTGVYKRRRGPLSNAEIALLERYKAKNNLSAIVDNTIDEIVSDSIYEIKEAVDNMIAYGDPNVYRVLPKELDKKMRDYGMVAQEYFGKKGPSKDTTPVFIVPETYKQCNVCLKFKPQRSTAGMNFYTSYSDTSNGLTSICCDCAKKLFSKYLKEHGIREALVIMSQKLDIVVISEVLEQYVEFYNTAEGKKSVLDGVFFSDYYQATLLSFSEEQKKDDLSFCKSNLHGEPFRDVIPTFDLAPIYDDITVKKSKGADDDDELARKYPSLSKLKQKWGSFEKADLYWLEDKYNEWYEKCEIDGLSREKLVIQLCYEELSIVRTREKGGNVKDKVRSFQTLMKDAELTPKKQSISGSSESQFTSLGEFIKAAEVKGPIISKNKAFKDADSFERLWKSIAGAISRTLGRDNEYVRDFEENYKDYTVDFNRVTESSDSTSDNSEVEEVGDTDGEA